MELGLPRDLVCLGCYAIWSRTLFAGTCSYDSQDRQGSDALICCAGERGELGERFHLSLELLLRCEEIPAHPVPYGIHTWSAGHAFTDD